MKKRIICLILSLVLAVGILPFSAFSGVAVNRVLYSREKSLAFAKANWNSGKGLCAEFVRDCLNAGDVPVSTIMVFPLYRELKDIYGTSYVMKLTGGTYGKIVSKDNKGKVEAGDPLFYYCNYCGNWQHVVLAGGVSVGGYVTDYAHNAAHNNTKDFVTFSCTKCGSNDWTIYSIHMFTETKPTTAKVSVGSKIVKAGGEIKFTMSCDATADYELIIEKDGAKYSSDKTESKTITKKFDEGGVYTAYCKATNSLGSVTSPKITWTVYEASSENLIKSVSISTKGAVIKFGLAAGATGYNIYRKEGSAAAVIIKKITAENVDSYTDDTVKSGTKYTYYVTAVTANGEISHGKTEKTIIYLATPKIYEVENTAKGVAVRWNEIIGAEDYIVYRKLKSETAWTNVGKSTSAVYSDTLVESGKEYMYTVRAANGTYKGGYYNVNPTIVYLSLVTGIKASNTFGGVNIKWSAVNGAAGYKIFRKTASADWVLVETVEDGAAAEYIDKAPEEGVKYNYTVRAYKGGFMSAIPASNVSVTYLRAPSLISLAIVKNGINVRWEEISGADSYRFYRKTEGGKWTLLSTVTGTSFTDTDVVDGTDYYYTVRASKSGLLSGYRNDNAPFTYLAPVAKITAKNAGGGVKVSWKSMPGAKGYRIYQRQGAGNLVLVGSVDDPETLTFLDTTPENGKSYSYAVRSYSGDAVSMNPDKLANIDYIAAPTLSAVKIEKDGISVKWNPVEGAVKYRFYKKVKDGSWKLLSTQTETSYLDKSVKGATEYVYTVRTVISDTELSGYIENEPFMYLLPVEKIKAVNYGPGIKVTWGAVGGATGYVVYRKTATSGWSRIGVIEDGTCSYVDSTPKNDTQYYYIVRATNKTAMSANPATNAGIHHLQSPKLVSMKTTFNGVAVTWGAVKTAECYKVYRKTGDGAWKLLSTVDGTTYEDTKVVGGTTYRYTVRAVSKSETSSYYDDNETFTYLLPVKNITSANVASGVKVSWEAVSGATGYNVYRKLKTSTAKWSKVCSVEGGNTLSATDTSAVSGKNYYYLVKAVNGSAMSANPSKYPLIYYIAAPVLVSAKNTSDGVNFTYESVAGAKGYYIYRKTDGGSWRMIAEVSGKTTVSYIDRNTVSGKKYTYTAKAFNGDNVSSFKAGKSCTAR